MTSVAHIQAYLRRSAQQHYESIPVPPFTIFLHPRDSLHFFNYAIPDAPILGDNVREALAMLRQVFWERDRLPRFEFIKEFAPQLAGVLQSAGFVEESRLHLMVCTPDSYQSAPTVPQLSITMLTPESPLADVKAYKLTQQQGFDPENSAPVDDALAEQFRADVGANGRFLARIDDQPVGVAAFSAPLDGVVEVAGVATVESFRRRGVAAALTAEAVRVAFARGVQVACLSAADERAGRVYERVGFRPYATMLAYRDAE